MLVGRARVFQRGPNAKRLGEGHCETVFNKGNNSSDLTNFTSERKATPHFTHACTRTPVDIMQGLLV